ncbi:MAG: GerMN domain-containing protein [Syntrophomonadaceae bacterium]|jgi:germination protein M
MKGTRLVLFVVILTMMAMLAVGCKPTNQDNADVNKNPAPAAVTKEVTLYFSDKQAEFLVAEKRTIQVAVDELQQVAKAVVNELIAGPRDTSLSKTIPPEARLLSVNIQDKTAVVDFSTELQTKHWGGSAGETMTIMSIVNSLTELPGIEKVQFLIEGQKQESLVGHWDLTNPIPRDQKIIK